MKKTEQRLLALTALLAILLTTPFIKIVNIPARWMGLPVFFIYVGAVWIMAIVGIGYSMYKDKKGS